MGRRFGRYLVTVLVALPVLALAPPAHASCAEGSGPEGAPVVFVGTAEVNRRGYTRLAVVEVWHGPDLAPNVWVLSGQEQPSLPLNLVQVVASSTGLTPLGPWTLGIATSSVLLVLVAAWRLLRRRRTSVRDDVASGLPPAG